MCEYCLLIHGHAMGCPNAPDPEPIERCCSCGALIYEEDDLFDTIYGVFCGECAEELYGDESCEEGDE